MRVIKFLVLVVFFFVSMLFFVQNTPQLSTPLTLSIEFLQWKFATSAVPFYAVLLLAFASGAVVAALFFVGDKLRSTFELSRSHSKVAALEAEAAKCKAATPVAPVESAAPKAA